MTDGHFSQRVHTYEQESAWILSKAFIAPLVPPIFGNGLMLDVCAGTGVIAKYALRMGWQAFALDNNKDMLNVVPSPITTILCDAHHIPFPDNTFDLVTIRQGIQYLNYADAIQEMLRVSKSQVRMLHGFIKQDDIPDWQELFALSQGSHRSFFSCTMIDSAIEQCSHSDLKHKFLSSRECFKKPPQSISLIDKFLMEHPKFMHNYSIENHDEYFFYDLNWVLHIIEK